MYGNVIYGPRRCAVCQNGYDGQGRNEIHSIQMALGTLGYLTAADATGQYGTRTYNAVMEFQDDYGLVNDGRVGPNTLGRILEQADRRAKAQAALVAVAPPTDAQGAVQPDSPVPPATPIPPSMLTQITAHKMFYPTLIGSVLLIGGAVYWKRKK